MRLAAIAKNIKASGVCGVHYVGPLREVWIMTAHGIYRLNGYPKPIDRDETAMMFGIGPKTMENIAYNDFTDEDATWLEGYNLTDSVEGEIRLVTMDIDVSIHGQELRLLTDEQKNVIAIATADDLAPLQGEFANSAYMAFYLRTSSQGEKYIVVKDGFFCPGSDHAAGCERGPAGFASGSVDAPARGGLKGRHGGHNAPVLADGQ